MIIYLYVKQHSITGIKYFGKTVTRNPFKYTGSGKLWKRHFKKHGKQFIQTLDVWGFDDINICNEFALKYSRDNNIVNSKEWANLIIENGADGAPRGNIVSQSTRNKIAQTLTGISGRTLTQSGRDVLSSTRTMLNKSSTFKAERSAEMKKRYASGWKSHSAGKRWITNGVDNQFILREQPIPQNWYSGRTMVASPGVKPGSRP